MDIKALGYSSYDFSPEEAKKRYKQSVTYQAVSYHDFKKGQVVAFYHAVSRHGVINDSWSQDCIRYVTYYSFAALAKLLTR